MSDAADKAPLSDRLYQSILEAIVDGEFKLGDKLPTEHELAQRYEASRPIVREALARLRFDDIITSRRGAGSFVVRRPSAPIRQMNQVTSVADIQRCFEFREVLETEVAALAAVRADSASIKDVTRTFKALSESVAAGGDGVDEDWAFHVAVARAAGNDFFVDAIANIESQIRFSTNFGKMLSDTAPQIRLKRVVEEHDAVVSAIAAHDPERARTAMRNHLRNSRRRMFEGDG